MNASLNLSSADVVAALGHLKPEEMEDLLACERRLEAFDLEGSLSKFTAAAWPIIEPATVFKPSWYLDAIDEHLMAVTLGQIKRLIINIPPRHTKSIKVSVIWPCWSWAIKPEDRFLFASYSGSLATKHSVDRRTLLRSRWFRERWGHLFELADDQNQKTEFANTKRGHMVATTLGGTSTGKGGNKLVVDDPINPEQAQSEVERATANRQFDQTLMTRLDQPMTDAIVLIMQRLHEDDTTGHVLSKRSAADAINLSDWTVLKLPSEITAREVVYFPISRKTHVRERGELLNPSRFPQSVLDQAKIDLGPIAYAGQHLQSPAALEGNIIRRSWLRFFVPFDAAIPAAGTYNGLVVPEKDWQGRPTTINAPEKFDEIVQSQNEFLDPLMTSSALAAVRAIVSRPI